MCEHCLFLTNVKTSTFLYQFTTDLFLRSACNKLIDLLWLIFHISPSSNYYFQLLQHYCQYVENGTRLISIATTSRISALQTPHWHAALRLLHNRRNLFLFIQLFLVPPYPSCNRQFHYPAYFFVRAKSEAVRKSQKSLPEDCIVYDFLSRIACRGATASEIHREIKWPGKIRQKSWRWSSLPAMQTRDNWKVRDGTIIIGITHGSQGVYLVRGILRLISQRGALIVGTCVHFSRHAGSDASDFRKF